MSGELLIANVGAGSYQMVATVTLPGIPEQRLMRPFVIVR
jgi:hypothetical protein